MRANRSESNAHSGLKAGVRLSCVTPAARNGRFIAVPLLKWAGALCVAAAIVGSII